MPVDYSQLPIFDDINYSLLAVFVITDCFMIVVYDYSDTSDNIYRYLIIFLELPDSNF